jgi:DNA-binding SARP family transcriptional activator/tetratricopeptide (TPR) repeat protein
MLRLWLQGPLAGELDGRPVAMPTSDRARALIGWLALHPGRHPRSEVAARLWPDVPETSARGSLRTAVWSVRQAWGPAAEVLESSRLGIGLPAGAVWVDALDDSPGREPATGDLLEGVDDDWARAARAEHLTRRLGELNDAAEVAEGDGRIADAVALSRRACRLAPLDEAAHRALLTRLQTAGDRAAAVVAAREFAELLRAELGVRPSPATRAVQAQLRTPGSPPVRPRLFGRSAELTRLTASWKAAAGGAGQVVVLSGEAGIGKTSLLAELAHRARAAGARTAVGAGLDIGGETPFAVWLDLAGTLAAGVAPVPDAASWPTELNRLSPELGARLGRTGPAAALAAPELERLRVFESVLRLVEWACTDRPVLLAIDDAHRADRASLRLTAHIGRRLAGLPVLVVLVRRDRPAARPELDAMLADLAGRSVPVTEIPLAPIGEAAVAALATSIAPMDDGLLRRVLAAAEGNPLLAVESARVVAAGGTGPPPNLRTAVRASTGLLPASARTLLALLAVAARPLSRRELDGLGVPDLAAAEEAAGSDGLVVRRQGRLGFRHALLRDVVYGDLPDPAPLHDRVVAALEPADRAEIAHHLTLAGRDAEAATEWAAAAARARSLGAPAEAAAFLVRATGLVPQDGRLWLELAEVYAWLGRRADMDAAWERGLALMSGPEVPRAWCRRGRQLRSVVCHPDGSMRAYRQAEALLLPDSDAALRADTLIGLAWGDAVTGGAGGAGFDALLAAGEALLPAERDPRTAADIAEIRMQGLIRQGRFAEAVEIALAAAPAAVRAQLPERAWVLWIHAACALTCVGDYDGALAAADEAVTATGTLPVMLVSCLAARALILARLGRHPEAAVAAELQRRCADRLDAPALAATAAHDAGLVALAAGRYAEAAELLDAALLGGAEVSRPTAGLYRAEALALLGDPVAATAQLRAAVLEPVGRADQPWALVPRIAWVQGLVALARQDQAQARRRFEEATASWHRVLATAAAATADGYLANMVDLGRPPVLGLVEPERELARIGEALSSLVPDPARR